MASPPSPASSAKAGPDPEHPAARPVSLRKLRPASGRYVKGLVFVTQRAPTCFTQPVSSLSLKSKNVLSGTARSHIVAGERARPVPGRHDPGTTATQQKGSSMRLLVLGFLALLCLASQAACAAVPDPPTDDQQLMYALGPTMCHSPIPFTPTLSAPAF